jgi:hypothetical protein
MFTDDKTRPRHLSTGKCICQFIEEHFKSEQREQIKDFDATLEENYDDDIDKDKISASSDDDEDEEEEDNEDDDETESRLDRHEGSQPAMTRTERDFVINVEQDLLASLNRIHKAQVQTTTATRNKRRQKPRRSTETEAITYDESYNEDDDSRTIKITIPNGLNDKAAAHDGESKRLESSLAACTRALLHSRLQSGNNAVAAATTTTTTTTTTTLTTKANVTRDEHDRRQSCGTLVPTLSHLVGGMKGRQDSIKANHLCDHLDVQPAQRNHYPSKLIEGVASHLQQERIDSRSSQTTELSSVLEIGGGVGGDSLTIERNDELIKKLKLLLEFRANLALGEKSRTDNVSWDKCVKLGAL